MPTTYHDSMNFYGDFSYHLAVGKLNNLGQTTRPDILYAVHQVNRYSSDPRLEHGEAKMYTVKCLKASHHIGICFKLDAYNEFLCYCDTDFSGNLNKEFAATDLSTVKSRSGWIVFFAAFPIIWASKLQLQVALSTTKAKYIAMSMALCDFIPLIKLIRK